MKVLKVGSIDARDRVYVDVIPLHKKSPLPEDIPCPICGKTNFLYDFTVIADRKIFTNSVYIVCDGSIGDVKLYYADAGSSLVKFQTKANGVAATGNIEAIVENNENHAKMLIEEDTLTEAQITALRLKYL